MSLRPASRSTCAPKLWAKSFSLCAGNAFPKGKPIASFLRRLPPSSAKLPVSARFNSLLSAQKALPVRSLQSRFFSSNGNDTPSVPVVAPPSVGGWLLLSSALVLAIIVVGGVTRLTESGLSITEWRPITGVMPPLSHEDWMVEFNKYKATPEFKL